MKRAVLILLAVLTLVISAAAQSKFSAAAQCGTVDKDYKIEVGDQPGHAYQIYQGKCSYTKGEIAGIRAKEEVFAGSYEISGNTALGRFSSFMPMANGDRVHVSGEDTLTLKNGMPQSVEGKWSFRGGTGKFAGLKGKGIFKVKFAADGTSTAEIQGEYELAK